MAKVKEKKATRTRAKRARLKAAKPPERPPVVTRVRPKPYLRVPVLPDLHVPDPAIPEPPPPQDLPKPETILRDHLFNQSLVSSW